MNIDRHNYEEFFMLYADNELTAEERKDVESFVEQNTDLAPELNLLKQLQFKPDTDLVFACKEGLFRTEEEHTTVNINNYEEFFVLYADNELTNEQQVSVEKFVYKYPSYQAEFELIQETRLQADTSIVYNGKDDLYRHEKDEKVVPFFVASPVWKWAAAAVLILLAGILWLNQVNDNKLPVVISKVDDKNQAKPIPQTNSQEEVKADQLAITSLDTTAKPKKTNLREINTGKTNSVVKKSMVDANDGSQDAAAAEEKARDEEKKDMVALQHLASGNIKPVITAEENISTSKNITDKVQPKNPIIDQPVYFNNEKDIHDIRYADLNDKGDDVIYVSGTSVRKQNPLRGIFRKASRFVERTTNARPSDGSSIMIGNLSIAIR